MRAAGRGGGPARTWWRASRAARTGPVLCLLGHVDTVLADAGDWSVDPWSGELRDGCVWGRGALDMKSQVAAEIAAACALARGGLAARVGRAARDRHRRRGGGREHGAKWLCEQMPDSVRCDFVVNEGGGDSFEFDGRRLYLVGDRREGRVPVHAHDARAAPATRRSRGSATTRSSSSRPLIEALAGGRAELEQSPEASALVRGARARQRRPARGARPARGTGPAARRAASSRRSA